VRLLSRNAAFPRVRPAGILRERERRPVWRPAPAPPPAQSVYSRRTRVSALRSCGVIRSTWSGVNEPRACAV